MLSWNMQAVYTRLYGALQRAFYKKICNRVHFLLTSYLICYILIMQEDNMLNKRALA